MSPEYIPEKRVIEFDTFDIVSIIRGFVNSVFGNGDGAGSGGGASSSVFNTLAGWWEVYSIIALLVSALFFIGFIYAKIKLGQLSAIIQQDLRNAEIAWAHAYGGAVSKNSRWADITEHAAAGNPNDWRLAIIEADIMLEEVLDNAGYEGNTIGDRLKSARVMPFQTLDDAWEAHKVRNKIAHAGSDFVLTQKIAQATITQFERVFREFDAI